MSHDAHDPLRWIDGELDLLAAGDLLRTRQTHAGSQHVRIRVGDQELINFGSNDYLALAADPRLAAAAAEAALAAGSGAGASPLVTGYSTEHALLERDLAEFEGTERALLFSSGYAANLGTIAALAGRGDAIFADQKNHASMIDGCRLARADVHVYPHRDWRALEKLLGDSAAYRRRLIVTESVFSMDGDLAPLVELADLAERHDAMLLVDEAHATGVFGQRGRGVAEQLGVEDRVHIRIGTLSKALGGSGGFVCGRAALIDWLVNKARPYVFSTALPPAVCAAARCALSIVAGDPRTRESLLALAERLRQRLREQGWNLGSSESQIVPLVVGEPSLAVDLARQWRKLGLLVPAIRPPSVPTGESLLRISLSAGHDERMIDQLCSAIAPFATSPARDCVALG